MNLNLIAADLAKRVPDMAQDSATNNEQLILSLLQQANVRIYMNPQCGVALIDRERTRQVMQEGWTPEHDDTLVKGELASASRTYAEVALVLVNEPLKILAPEGARLKWPLNSEGLKISHDPVVCLVKAGALIAAEIDRLQRLNQRNPQIKETL